MENTATTVAAETVEAVTSVAETVAETVTNNSTETGGVPVGYVVGGIALGVALGYGVYKLFFGKKNNDSTQTATKPAAPTEPAATAA